MGRRAGGGRAVWAVGLALAAAPAGAQVVFQGNTADIPSGAANAGYSENVDFADVDGDGDFDVAFANGGDLGDEQNRLWINQGGLQGGTLGVFVDETATRLPAIADPSRDIEFADIDGDGDPDLYVANSAQVSNEASLWWINQGGAQGGSAGFFVDETAARWVNVGVNNGSTTFSSIPAGLVLPGGGFIDWSCDCDFGDLDNDGDLDLVHSSYGGSFSGQVPTRLFLNDGDGNFEEFNPSGHQLLGQTIQNGDPGLWCEGAHLSNTTNATGAQCDVASAALDVDLGDLDGDLDLDLVHGARDEAPRVFHNRLEENAGVLGFRDVTGAVFPPGYVTGGGHYEQELGDLDNDDDLDLLGVNWDVGGLPFGFFEVTFENTGTGIFGAKTRLPSSEDDDSEGDFLDHDGDGDLDLFVSSFAFSEPDRLYRNDLPGGSIAFSFLSGAIAPDNTVGALDVDACDVDGDGDPDAFVANDAGNANLYCENVLGAADVHAPRIVNVEQAPDRVTGPAPTVVRAHEYDNQAYYASYLNAHTLEYRVGGGAWTSLPAAASGGQVLRGEIPGAVFGAVEYRFRSVDSAGNVGLSAVSSYVATCGGSVATYCTAKLNSLGCLPAIAGAGLPSASATAGFTVSASLVRNNKAGLLFYRVGGARADVPFQCGTLCVGPSGIRRTPAQSAGGTPPPTQDCSGAYATDMNAFAAGLAGGNPSAALSVPGNVVHCQWWGRDQGFGPPCNTLLSDALEYHVCP